MMYELSQLPVTIQQHITEAKAPVEIVNNGQVVAMLNPTFEKLSKKADFVSAYDYFKNIPVSDEIADIEFDLPPRNKTLYPPEDLD